MVRASTDTPTTVTPQPEPASLIPSARSVSQGVRPSASRRRSQVLARSPSLSHDVRSDTAKAEPRMTKTRSSHAVVLMAIGCGSGGAPAGVLGAAVCSVFSLTGPPASFHHALVVIRRLVTGPADRPGASTD